MTETLRAGRPMDVRYPVPGLRPRRERAGLTAAGLCRLLQRYARVSPSTLIGWEKERGQPSAAIVSSLARILNCEERDLYGGRKR